MVAIDSEDDQATTSHSVFPGFDRLDENVDAVISDLASRRRATGLTQADVAARMRTSQPAVARLEAGRGDLRVSTLQRYAHALGLTMRFGVAPGDDGGRT